MSSRRRLSGNGGHRDSGGCRGVQLPVPVGSPVTRSPRGRSLWGSLQLSFTLGRRDPRDMDGVGARTFELGGVDGDMSCAPCGRRRHAWPVGSPEETPTGGPDLVGSLRGTLGRHWRSRRRPGGGAICATRVDGGGLLAGSRTVSESSRPLVTAAHRAPNGLLQPTQAPWGWRCRLGSRELVQVAAAASERRAPPWTGTPGPCTLVREQHTAGAAPEGLCG